MLKSGPYFAFALLASAASVAAGCGGGSHFKNDPRPPAPVQLTGVITEKGVTVSPNRLGAGPIRLLVSNQTDKAHTIVLDGGDIHDTVGPVNPGDTATVQQTLERGKYMVKAGSPQAVAHELKPAKLVVGPTRKSSSGQLLLP